VSGQQPKAFRDALNCASGNIDASAVAGDVHPDAVKLGFRLGQKTRLAHRRAFCSAASRATPRRLMSSVSWATSSGAVILRPWPRRQGSFSLVDSRKDFQPPPLAFSLAAEPARLDARADERLLVGGQV